MNKLYSLIGVTLIFFLFFGCTDTTTIINEDIDIDDLNALGWTDTNCDGKSCNVTNTGTLDGFEASEFYLDTNPDGFISSYSDTNNQTASWQDSFGSWLIDINAEGQNIFTDKNVSAGENFKIGDFCITTEGSGADQNLVFEEC